VDIWKRRFSIRDLLIIAAIAAGLTAVFMPKTTTREYRYEKNSCSSHVRQLSNAILLYSRDYDDKLPPRGKWSDAINPYVHYKYDMFSCPQAPGEHTLFGLPGLVKGPLYCNYSYNDKLDINSIRKLPSPSSTPMLFDSNGGWNSISPVTRAVPRHSEGFICGYVDGHVTWVKG